MLIVLGHEKGGVGKSSTAVNFAAIAVSQGVQTLLIDADSTRSASTWVGIRAEEAIDPQISSICVADQSDASVLNTIADLSTKYELLILDIGARSYDLMLKAALMSDLFLVPVSPGQFEAESTIALFDALRSIDIRHKDGRVPAHVVLNKISTNSRSTEEADIRTYFQELSIPVLTAVLRDRKAWRELSRTGRALHELKGRDASKQATAEMLAVYEEAEALVE